MTEIPATVKKTGLLTSIIVGILTIIAFAISPYKEFTNFKYENIQDREKLWNKIAKSDSTARVWIELTRENNYNLREYFERGQPKNYKWKTEAQITEEMNKKYPK